MLLRNRNCHARVGSDLRRHYQCPHRQWQNSGPALSLARRKAVLRRALSRFGCFGRDCRLSKLPAKKLWPPPTERRTSVPRRETRPVRCATFLPPVPPPPTPSLCRLPPPALAPAHLRSGSSRPSS